MNYQRVKELSDREANDFAKAVDYEVGWSMADKIVERTTKYSGIGRPRKTDCDIYKHPFDGRLRKIK